METKNKTKVKKTPKVPKIRKNAATFETKMEILHLYHYEGMNNKKIGEQLNKDTTTISRIKKEAEKQYLITIIKAPSLYTKEIKLQTILGINKVKLVSNGSGKNSEHLGYAAAKYLCSLIQELFINKSEINLGVSCGASIRFTCKRLVEELRDNSVNLSGKTINIYPSALIGGNKFSDIAPVFTASRLAERLLSLPVEARPNVSCVRSILPPTYYHKNTPDKDKKIIGKYCGFSSILPDPVNHLDILISGIGRALDDEYLLACEQSGIVVDKSKFSQDTPEVNFSPIGNVNILPEYQNIVSGITVNQMRDMCNWEKKQNKEGKKNEKKYVITLIGGKEKKGAAKIAFQNPHFNVLFSDLDICEYLIKDNKKEVINRRNGAEDRRQVVRYKN